MSEPFHDAGLKFDCTGCGDCCRARNTTAYVYVTRDERARLARHLGLAPASFTRRYCERSSHGFWHLRNPAADCVFLDGARCTVYAARPGQCRTFPFWNELMSPAAWAKAGRGCEGIGRGTVWPLAEIRRRLAAERRRDTQN